MCTIDPRWWRFSDAGTSPVAALERLQGIAAGVIITSADRPIGASVLAGLGGSAGTGVLDVHCTPGHEDEVRSIMPDLVDAAFDASDIRHLYHERFDDDADLMTETTGLWTLEATLKEFARVGGRYADRLVFGVSRAEYERWWVDRHELRT